MDKKLRIVISGGGTGGHIFPAVSIANAIREKHPDADILFVGAEGRMEMKRVPQAGYKIVALPIVGFNRSNLLKNITLPYKMWKSDRMVKKILRQFKPMAAVGVGGYVSFPTLKAAASKGIPCVIQEQNSFAGKANKILAKDKNTKRICVAYEGMERFFPQEKLMLTGNPVRQALLDSKVSREDAVRSFGLKPECPVVLIIGGSLGARTMNESVLAHLGEIGNSNVQFIWQTGSYYHASIEQELKEKGCPDNLKMMDFITDMGAAYKAADLVISRAGASSISELCLLGKPSILVPSPNVAEDHQTHNAMALVNRDAAMIVKDAEAQEKLIPLAIRTLGNADKNYLRLGQNAKLMALPDSANIIADEVIRLAIGE